VTAGLPGPTVAGERWLVAALFVALSLQLGYGLWTDGATDDEVTYIGAGYRHLHGDFRIDADHPPLAKMIGALPLLVLRPTMAEVRPDDDQDGWGHRFINETNAELPVVRVARLSAVLLTLLFAGMLWMWARAVGGPAAGFLALAVVAFQPGFLAHGHLVTTDMACAFFMVLTSWCYWRFEQAPTAAGAALVALSAAAALLSRSTTLVILPALLALGLVRWIRSSPDCPRPRRAATTLLAAFSIVVPLSIWAAYGFRDAPGLAGAGTFGGPWPRGLAGPVLPWLAQHHLLPQAYIEGWRFQIQHQAEGHPSCLFETRSKEGWWYYFLVVVLVKNTPGFLLLLAGAIALAAFGRDRPAVWRHWLVPAAITFAAASLAHVQLGERYILPVYAYAILGIATAVAPLLQTARGRAIVAVALIAHAAPVLMHAPRGYLAYFNAIAGGPDGGHHWLADSNLDWGQDLPRLAQWLRNHGVGRIQLGYFGSDDPHRYGIACEDLPTWPHTHRSTHAPAEPFRGTVVVSPNLALGYLYPPGRSPYERLRGRVPDARAGIFFVYRLD
jgi:Dolichyl-phosphate-mannose-protein mannosyltransferase